MIKNLKVRLRHYANTQGLTNIKKDHLSMTIKKDKNMPYLQKQMKNTNEHHKVTKNLSYLLMDLIYNKVSQ